jgi:hypothetical protein
MLVVNSGVAPLDGIRYLTNNSEILMDTMTERERQDAEMLAAESGLDEKLEWALATLADNPDEAAVRILQVLGRIQAAHLRCAVMRTAVRRIREVR